MQDQTDVHRLPVRLPHVVQGVPVAGQLLLTARAQAQRGAGDDAVGPTLVRHHDALECGGRLHLLTGGVPSGEASAEDGATPCDEIQQTLRQRAVEGCHIRLGCGRGHGGR